MAIEQEDIDVYDAELPTSEEVLADPDLQVIEAELCSRSFWYFALRWVWTKDTNHCPSHRRFPDKPYLRHLIAILTTINRLLVKKSRRMLLTWLLSAYCVWLCLFHENKQVAIQSADLDDSIEILGNRKTTFITYILQYLPPFFFDIFGEVQMNTKWITFANGSSISGIPEGDEQLRGPAFALWFADEAGKHKYVDKAIGASVPTLSGGGTALLGSSVIPGEFMQYVKDKLGGEGTKPVDYTEPIPITLVKYCDNPKHVGLTIHTNPWNGWTVLQCHYTADEDKDPCNETGLAWYTAERAGISDRMWNQEYEMDDEALSASLVLYPFNKEIHVKPIPIDPTWTPWEGFDIGIGKPAAGIYGAVTPDGDIVFYDELYGADKSISICAEEMKTMENKAREEIGIPEPIGRYCDPAMNTRMFSGKTPIEEFMDQGDNSVCFIPSDNDMTTTVLKFIDYLQNTVDHKHPAVYFTPNMVETINEIENWKYREGSDKPVDKNNHAIAAIRYLLIANPFYIPREPINEYFEGRREYPTGQMVYTKVITNKEDYR